jgi:hypothetical protein
MSEDFSQNMVTVTMSGKKAAVIATVKSFFGDPILESTIQDEITGRPDTFIGIFTLYISDEEIKIELEEDEVI